MLNNYFNTYGIADNGGIFKGEKPEGGQDSNYTWEFDGNSIILNDGGTLITDRAGIYATTSNTVTELVAFDSDANESTISPHNFSLIGQPSEDMAWSFYSKNTNKNKQVKILHFIIFPLPCVIFLKP